MIPTMLQRGYSIERNTKPKPKKKPNESYKMLGEVKQDA